MGKLVSYYSSLYNQTTKVKGENVKEAVNKFLGESDYPKLAEGERNQCEGSITVEEASIAAKSLKNGTSPGSDGLTTEFVKYFWKKRPGIIPQICKLTFTGPPFPK